MTEEKIVRQVDRSVAVLAEHFPNVQIMVSWPDENGMTRQLSRGAGDWYARQGMAHEFIALDRARDQAYALARVIHPPDSNS